MRNRAVIAGVVMLLTVLSAFAAIPATTARASAEQPGILYVAMQQDMPDFNTWNLGSNSVWKANVINWGFETIAGLDYNMLPYPMLAESWEFDEDTLEVTINLREGVMFHDGTEMTADDVVFTYSAARDGTTYSSNIVNAFDDPDDTDSIGVVTQDEIDAGVQKVDDYTVLMTMATPYGQFFTSTLGVPIVPMHIWEDHLVEDGIFDVLWNDPDAAVGTAAFMYKEGIANTYRIMEKYTDYWGQDFTTPAGYKLYPPNVDQIYYKIYASLDTAILALQSGAVDYIAWPITAGRVPALQADPNVGLEFLEDNGYFYLAFNMKFEPMNSIDFRQAVSHLIDKDQIVDVYMGGFGSKGSAVQPPYWGEWMNTSIETYPYDSPFDGSSSVPEDMLDDAGFVDVNGDNWRDLPDGTPMQKIVILTPPADYDPIRIRAGQMIAKNMREVGINAEAKAIDFDTLVARLNSMDYQMLIIGWSLTSEPVTNVFDILGPLASGNTFGFWAEENPNPFYVDLQGVNTLADEETQQLARDVDWLGQQARASFDTETQIMYTKWGQGVLAEAVPCNVLYYRVNILAYRATSWTGWLPYLGDIFGPGTNIYSLSNLEKVGAGGAAGGATASVNAGLTVPGKVGMDQTVDAVVVAIDNSGSPVSGASVALTIEGVAGAPDSVEANVMTGTTNTNGVFAFNLTGVSLGYSYVNVTVTSSGVTSTQSTAVSCVQEYYDTLFMSVTPEKSILAPWENTTVMLTVVDMNGDPVEDAELAIDENLMGYGTIDDLTLMTDADGYAETIYRAPQEVEMNTHLTLTLSYSVSKDGYTWRNAAAANMMVYNDAEPDWVMVRVEDVATTALDSGANTTSIDVLAIDDDANPLADYTLHVSYSNDDMVFVPETEVLTDGSGMATLDVQLKDMAESAALRVTLTNESILNCVPATVTLTYVGDDPPATEMFGGYMTFAESDQYMEQLGSLDVTAYVWNSTGDLTNGVMAALMLSATQYGSLVWSDDIEWDSLWDYLGIAISTTNDEGAFVTSGPLNTPFDEDNYWTWTWDQDNDAFWWLWWDWGMMTGVEIVDGEFTTTVYGVDVAHVDQLAKMYLIPDAIGYFNDTTYGYQVDGSTALMTDYVIGRSYNAVAPVYEVSEPVLIAKTSGFDSSFVDVWVTDETGNPIEGASVSVYEAPGAATDYTVVPYVSDLRRNRVVPVPTDVDGYAQVTVLGVGNVVSGGVVVADLVQPSSMLANLYVKAGMEGYVSIFSQTQIFIYTQQTFVSIAPITDVGEIGDMILVEASVVDYAGDPLANVPVEVVLGAGTVANAVQATDSNGKAVFAVDTSDIRGAKAAFVPVQAKAAGPGYELSLATAMVAVMNPPTTISMGYPMDGAVDVDGSDLTLSGTAVDSNGIQTVVLTVDGEVVAVEGTVGAMLWEISAALGDVEDGDHTVVVNATDMLGLSTEVTVEFSTTTPSEGISTGLAIALGIGWIVAAVVIVLLLMKMRPKGPKAVSPAEPELEPEKEEEPLPTPEEETP